MAMCWTLMRIVNSIFLCCKSRLWWSCIDRTWHYKDNMECLHFSLILRTLFFMKTNQRLISVPQLICVHKALWYVLLHLLYFVFFLYWVGSILTFCTISFLTFHVFLDIFPLCIVCHIFMIKCQIYLGMKWQSFLLLKFTFYLK